MGDKDGKSILVVSDFPDVPKKFATHFEPLAETGVDITIVCIRPDQELDDVNYVIVPTWNSRYIGLLFIPFFAALEGIRSDYAAVVSFSLFPYGLYALFLGKLFGFPAHLGIIGIDLDYHVKQWYGGFARHTFAKFDTISVPGEFHRSQLEEYGVDSRSIFILANSIDPKAYHPEPSVAPKYDFVWCGRLSQEKDPLLFVEGLGELRSSTTDFSAVILGSGELFDDAHRRIRDLELEDNIDMVGWVDEPASYYQQSKVFVLTSSRDALSTSMLEAMATGLPCITPPVGNVADAVHHEQNGILLNERNPDTLAKAMHRLLNDTALIDEMGDNAIDISHRYTRDAATRDWERILDELIE